MSCEINFKFVTQTCPYRIAMYVKGGGNLQGFFQMLLLTSSSLRVGPASSANTHSRATHRATHRGWKHLPTWVERDQNKSKQ